MKDMIAVLDNMIFAILMTIFIMLLLALGYFFESWFCHIVAILVFVSILFKIRK